MGPFSRVSSSVYPFRSSDSPDPMFVCRPSISLALILLFSQPPFDHLLAIVATASRIGRFEGQLISRSSHHRIIFHQGFSSIFRFFFCARLFTGAIIYQSICTRYILTCICCRRDEGESILLLSFQSSVVPRFVRFVLEPALL